MQTTYATQQSLTTSKRRRQLKNNTSLYSLRKKPRHGDAWWGPRSKPIPCLTVEAFARMVCSCPWDRNTGQRNEKQPHRWIEGVGSSVENDVGLVTGLRSVGMWYEKVRE